MSGHLQGFWQLCDAFAQDSRAKLGLGGDRNEPPLLTGSGQTITWHSLSHESWNISKPKDLPASPESILNLWGFSRQKEKKKRKIWNKAKPSWAKPQCLNPSLLMLTLANLGDALYIQTVWSNIKLTISFNSWQILYWTLILSAKRELFACGLSVHVPLSFLIRSWFCKVAWLIGSLAFTHLSPKTQPT